MFTGLVQVVGRVEVAAGLRLQVAAPGLWPPDNDPWQEGESIAIQGVCLTYLPDPSELLTFDLSEETLARTTLGDLRPGSPVNLERAMRPNDRLGGHIVQGHVDATATVESIVEQEGSWTMRFRVPAGGGRYLIDKGSICLDGVSLTVVSPDEDTFEVAIIPHTWANTSLSVRQPGDRVNVEYDVLAKHVERLLEYRGR
jgi:riboflavin synthase